MSTKPLLRLSPQISAARSRTMVARLSAPVDGSAMRFAGSVGGAAGGVQTLRIAAPMRMASTMASISRSRARALAARWKSRRSWPSMVWRSVRYWPWVKPKVARSSAGLPDFASLPILRIASPKLADVVILRSAAFSLSTTGLGVPAGANTAITQDIEFSGNLVRLLPSLLASEILDHVTEFAVERTPARRLDLCRPGPLERIKVPARHR